MFNVFVFDIEENGLCSFLIYFKDFLFENIISLDFENKLIFLGNNNMFLKIKEFDCNL